MRLKTSGFFTVILFVLASANGVYGQNCLNTGLNGSILNLPCHENCVTVPVHLPNIKQTSDYAFNSIPYTPYAYSSPTGTELSNTYIDDQFSGIITMPFSFCFYDSMYDKVVVSSNGMITFDVSNDSCASNYVVTTPIPSNQGTQCSISGGYYPRASIMGAYTDLDADPAYSPPERRVEYRTEGTAPCRKFIVSYYHIGNFGVTCGIANPNTFQIVLYESTGVIEVYIEQKACVSSLNGGHSIMGIQNWDQDQAVAAPGKNNTVWNESNTAYRFTPSGGATRFVSSEVFSLGGASLGVGDTATSVPGLLDVTFPSLCPPGATSQYVIQTKFKACDNPANILQSNDTITINKTLNLDATVAVTQTSCGLNPDGTLTTTIPTGLGTGPYTYVLNPGTTNATGAFTGLAAGAYTVTVTDQSGCSSQIDTAITSTGFLDVEPVALTTSCYGASNGGVNIPPINGTAPFTYSVTPELPPNIPITNTTGTFNTLPSGNYFLSVADNAGCEANLLPFTVEDGASIEMNANTVDPSCAGAYNGSIEVVMASGTAPYTYYINSAGAQTSNVFTGLSAAGAAVGGSTYFIDVTDAVGCKIVFYPVTLVASDAGISGTLSVGTTSCAGASDAGITVTPAGSTGPFDYSIDNGVTWQTANTFTGLAAGTYHILIREGGVCQSNPIEAIVSAGAGITATLATTSTDCAGVDNGSLTVTPDPTFTGPFTYSVDGGAFQSSNVFTGLSAGSHDIMVHNAGGCSSASLQATVAAGTTLTGTANSTSTECTGVDNGTIAVQQGTGFTGPFQYSLDGGPFQTDSIFTGVSAGPHNVNVRSASGCISNEIPVTVNTGTALTGTASSTATDCAGVSNGTVAVQQGTGFTGPFEYSLDGGAFQTDSIFTNVAAGPHNVNVRSASGCISNQIPVTVNAGTAITGAASSTSTACAGVSNGSVSVQPGAGFTGPFEYAIDGGAYQSDSTFTGIAAGSHNVRVRSLAGCESADIAVTVAAGTVLTGTASSTPITCFGANNGVISATATNGSGPYTFALDGAAAQGTGVFNGVSNGSHNVIIYDGYGCISNQIPVSVSQPTALTAAAPVVQNVICFAETNGGITVTPTGGTAPYTYSLDNVTYGTANTFALGTGTYSVYVKDVNGCSIQFDNLNITQPPVLGGSIVETGNATCGGGSDGTIQVQGTGGTAPYQYSSGGAFQSSDVLLVDPGTYTVTVKDANGCQYTITDVLVGLTDNLVVASAAPAPICEGTSVQLTATGNGASFTWTPSTGLGSSTGSAVTASPVTATTYTVTATLGRCTATADVMVDVMAAPVPDAGGEATICYGQDYQLSASPAGMTSYSWSPARYLSDANIANPTAVQPDRTTVYTLNVVDANNCASLIPATLTLNVTPPIKVTVTPVDSVVSAGAQVQLNATSIATQYTWTPATGLTSSTIANPVATAPGVGQTIQYQVIARTAADCIGEAYVTLHVYEGPEIYVPSGFSPNGDGVNDEFIPFPVGIKKLNYFRVFNRWGQVIYQTSTLNKGWDGKLAGTEQATGVYVWMVEGVTPDGKVIQKKGTVTLIR